MQQVFDQYPQIFGTDDILYHIGRYLEIIANGGGGGGSTILTGGDHPVDSIQTLPPLGSIYINTTTLGVYKRVATQILPAPIQQGVEDYSLGFWQLIASLKGQKGDTGNTGLAGNQVQSYANSIFLNSALELGNRTGLPNDVRILIDDNVRLNGLGSFKVLATTALTYINCPQMVAIDPTRLYKIEFFVRTETGNANASIRLHCQDVNGNAVSKTSGDIFGVFSQSSASPVFEKKTTFVGGFGNASPNFPQKTVFVGLRIVNDSQTNNVFFNRIVVEKVDLGEPVPYTLPYLPTGQMVYDPANGDVGRYNGTDINWFM